MNERESGAAPRGADGSAALRRRRRLVLAAAAAAAAAVAGLAVALMLPKSGEVVLEPAPPADTAEPATPSPPAAAPRTPTPSRDTPRDEEPEAPVRDLPAAITEADDGEIFRMRPGAHTALRLSNDWLWDPPDLRGDAVLLTEVAYFTDPGFVEWHVEAVAQGEAEVDVQGAPNCADEAACPPRRVAVRFVVDG